MLLGVGNYPCPYPSRIVQIPSRQWEPVNVVAQRVVVLVLVVLLLLAIGPPTDRWLSGGIRWQFVGNRQPRSQRDNCPRPAVPTKRLGIVRIQIEFATNPVTSIISWICRDWAISNYSPGIRPHAHEGGATSWFTADAEHIGGLATLGGKSSRLGYALHEVFPGALVTAANCKGNWSN